MAINDSLLLSIPENLLNSAGVLLNILKALGVVVIFYIIFNVINAVFNRKKQKQLKMIVENLEDIKKLLKKKR